MSHIKPKAMPAPTEETECHMLVQYLNIRGLLFTHIAQETPAGQYQNGRWIPNHRTLKKNRDMGVTKGFPDYVIFIPAEKSKCGRSKMLAIEMKRIYGSKVSPEQRMWIDRLMEVQGVETTIAYGFDEARDFIENYI